jgi:hypothetical protein
MAIVEFSARNRTSPAASPHRRTRPAPGTAKLRRRQHDEAVVRAQARRLALALAPYRVLSKKSLERVACAEAWHDGGFDRALAEAVRRGMIERLPGGFYADARACGRRRADGSPSD